MEDKFMAKIPRTVACSVALGMRTGCRFACCGQTIGTRSSGVKILKAFSWFLSEKEAND